MTPKLITVPMISKKGFLCFVQKEHLPFSLKRVFYIFKVSRDFSRGHHALYRTKQVLFCIQGSVDIMLDNGKKRTLIRLNKPNKGLFLDRLNWIEMDNFSKGAILLVFASRVYEPGDYISNYKKFLKIVNDKKKSSI
jgi:hypothetical protein